MDKSTIVSLTEYAPVCLFFYNRPQFVDSSFQSLASCIGARETDVFAFIDGPKTSEDIEIIDSTSEIVSQYTQGLFRNVTICRSERNKGLAKSIIEGVSKIVREYGCVIVLEDDLVVSKNFLCYMNSALKYYRDEKRVGSISGFGFKVDQPLEEDNFFHYRPNSWGWSTWNDRWEQAIWDISGREILNNSSFKKEFNRGGEDLYRMLKAYLNGKIDSWAIRWAYTHYRLGWLACCPFISKVKNYGYGEGATNCKGKNPFKTSFDGGGAEIFNLQSSISADPKLVGNMNWYNSNFYRLLCKLKLQELFG